MARRIAGDLAKAGICIVSGMARGIDTEAHQGTLDEGGKTIAFLGSGLDVIYPPENLDLYRRIQQSGAVLSEFPLGRKADRRTFPTKSFSCWYFPWSAGYSIRKNWRKHDNC